MTERFCELKRLAERLKLDDFFVFDPADILALTGIDCDSACLSKNAIYTDFRYTAAIHRTAPWLKVRDIKRIAKVKGRIGLPSSISYARFMQLSNKFPDSEFIDIDDKIKSLRMVKTKDEQDRIRRAEALNVAIWNDAKVKFAAGMTERDMARIIKVMMHERGDGEAFPTIVCVGANAAECHHVPDDTVWNGRDPVLVDMGVKLDGVCSDLTRNIKPKRVSRLYRQVYDLVKTANLAAIAAARPGITCRDLDKVARDIITSGGFGECFGHSLGHGVGYEIHEAPTVSKKSKVVLKPGMVVTIEPGIYLEGNIGVRIEDMILITESGCEVLSK